MNKHFLSFLLCSLLLCLLCSCNTISNTTPDTSEEEETKPLVEFISYTDDRYYSQYKTLSKGPSNVYNYGPGWEEKDFAVSIAPLYYMIYAAPGQDFMIPMSVCFTLGFKVREFEIEVTLADGQDQVLEILSVDKYKALDPYENCEGIAVRSLEPGVANVYIKLTYTPTGDNAVFQVIVVVQEP